MAGIDTNMLMLVTHVVSQGRYAKTVGMTIARKIDLRGTFKSHPNFKLLRNWSAGNQFVWRLGGLT